MERDRGGNDSTQSEGAYHIEHWLAYLMVIAAIALGTVGVIRGFSMIGGSFTHATAGASGSQAATVTAILDSVVWLLPAISAALLAMALHRNAHHRIPAVWRSAGDKALGNFEHWFAWFVAGCTIAMGVIGIVVGFGLWVHGDTQLDGIPWLLASIAGAGLTNALHSIRHHETVEEDEVVRMVQQRVSTPVDTRAPGTVRQPGVVREPGVEQP